MLRRGRILGPDYTPSASELQGAKPRSAFVQIIRFFSPWVVALLVLLGMLGGLQMTYVSRQGSVPAQRLQEFCQALVAKDYSTASAYVSHDTFGSSSAFEQANLARDAQIGPVRSCVVLGRNYFATYGPSTAGFDVAVTLSNGRHQGIIMLLDEGHADWIITSISPDLSLRL